jgi:hypothetical protein
MTTDGDDAAAPVVGVIVDVGDVAIVADDGDDIGDFTLPPRLLSLALAAAALFTHTNVIIIDDRVI